MKDREREREREREKQEDRDRVRFSYVNNNHNNGFAYHRVFALPLSPLVSSPCTAVGNPMVRTSGEGSNPVEQRASSMLCKHVATAVFEIGIDER